MDNIDSMSGNMSDDHPEEMNPASDSESDERVDSKVPPVVEEDNAEERLARSRDRNREHARRTRLRKKAQLQVLQARVKELQDESRMLRQTVEECSIASILLGLSSGDTKDDDDFAEIQKAFSTTETERTFFTMNGKRKRFVSDAGEGGPPPMKLKIKGQTTLVGGGSGKSHINWKTGVYLDENGEQKQLTGDELESLRRERNRMHAKMTRDRKKLFIASVEKTIADLEKNNSRMREILAKQAMQHSRTRETGEGGTVTPTPSPMLSAEKVSICSVPPLKVVSEVEAHTATSSNTSTTANTPSPTKKQKTSTNSALGFAVVA